MGTLLECFKDLIAPKGRIRQEEQIRQSKDRLLDVSCTKIFRQAEENVRKTDAFTQFVQEMQN